MTHSHQLRRCCSGNPSLPAPTTSRSLLLTLALRNKLSYQHITSARGTANSVGDEHQAMIPESHSLQTLFTELIHHHFDRDIGLRDSEVQDYIVNVLTEFCEAEQMFKLRNANDRPLDDVGEMLLEADPIYGPAPSFDRERQVRKHIGDYTLFLAGMFPESINHHRLRRQRVENFVEWVKAGKESYYIVSKFEHFEYAKVAPVFAQLSQKFEDCVYGLNLVKNELEVMQHPIVRSSNDLIT